MKIGACAEPPESRNRGKFKKNGVSSTTSAEVNESPFRNSVAAPGFVNVAVNVTSVPAGVVNGVESNENVTGVAPAVRANNNAAKTSTDILDFIHPPLSR